MSGGEPAALLSGRLEGDLATGCLWVVTNAPKERISVVWRDGYTARWDPLRLSIRLYFNGRFVAKAGDPISLGGGAQTLDSDLRARLGQCAVSRSVWLAGSPRPEGPAPDVATPS